MELRVLEYFLAVAREQSISKAAESLNLSQPTLSTQLKNLESELGKQLLIRGTKGSRKVILTDEGMILRKRAEEILSLVEKAEDEIASADDAVSGDVYIGTGESSIIRIFARTARKLIEENPDIHFHIQSGNSAFVTEQLDKGLIDFGMVYGPVDIAKYEVLNIPFCERWGVLMPSQSELSAKEVITDEDLKGKPIIISKEGNARSLIDKWFSSKSRMNVVATYNLVLNASMLTEEGLGYTICYDGLIDTSHNGPLVFRPLYPALYSDAGIIWKKYQIMSKASRKFLSALKDEFSHFS